MIQLSSNDVARMVGLAFAWLVAAGCDGSSEAESGLGTMQPASTQPGAAAGMPPQAGAVMATGGAGAASSAGARSQAGAGAPSSGGLAAPSSGGAGASSVAGAGASATAGSTAAPDAGPPPMDAATEPDAAPVSQACDRACLTEFNDAYLASLTAHDPKLLVTEAAVRFTENGKTLQLGEGLWAVAQTIGSYRQDFAEVPAGQTAGFAALKDARGDVLVAFRMKVVDRKVTELETTVCRTGEATFFTPGSLTHNDLYDMAIDPARRLPRDQMIATVELYFKGIESSDGSAIPFDSGARRNENGTTTGMGTGLQNVAMFSYIETIERRYALVDEERGNVLPWVLFQIPMGLTGSRTLHLAELFKVADRKIMDVQAIMVNQPLGTPSGWD